MRVVRDASHGDESRIVVRAIPIVRPLPDVAGHVIEAVAVRRIVCDRADANETVFPIVRGLYRMRDFGRQPNLKQLVKLTAVKLTTKPETSDWTVRFHSDISVSRWIGCADSSCHHLHRCIHRGTSVTDTPIRLLKFRTQTYEPEDRVRYRRSSIASPICGMFDTNSTSKVLKASPWASQLLLVTVSTPCWPKRISTLRRNVRPLRSRNKPLSPAHESRLSLKQGAAPLQVAIDA